MNGSGEVSDIFRIPSQANLIQLGLIVVVASLVIFLSQRALPWVADRFSGKFHLFLLGLVPLIRLVTILVAFVLIIPRLIEPTFENLIALFGALGLALGFAFKDYVSSLIAGVVTLFELPFRPGDWVEVNGVYGEVKAINMRTFELVTPDDSVVVIPHLKLWNTSISNANDGGQNLQCETDFYLDPHHDAELVRGKLHDVALTSAFLQIKEPINVIVNETPWGTHYRVRAYPIDPRQQFNFITDLTVRGKTALLGLGVRFASIPAITDLKK
ncbi:MAG: mechanosensitive ion channel family protein [Anaerolineales bacterium]